MMMLYPTLESVFILLVLLKEIAKELEKAYHDKRRKKVKVDDERYYNNIL